MDLKGGILKSFRLLPTPPPLPFPPLEEAKNPPSFCLNKKKAVFFWKKKKFLAI